MRTSGRTAPRRRVQAYERRREHRDGYRPTPTWDRVWAQLLSRVPGPMPSLFLRAVAARRRVVAALDGVEDALWLGALDPADLAAIDEHHHAEGLELVGQEWLAWTEPDFNLAGVAAWERSLIEGQVPKDGRVVVIGAGAGRELRTLLDAGYDAVGYEPNPTLVAAGRQTTLAPSERDRLRLIPRGGFPGAERCDAVLVGWNSYARVAGRAQRVALLAAARAAVAPGGSILLSFPERAGDTSGVRFKRLAASSVRVLRGRPPTELGDVLRPGLCHLFVPAEVAGEVVDAGLELVLYGSGSQPHAVARRPPETGA